MNARRHHGCGSSPAGKLTDPELMLRLRDGDPSALDALMHRYWDPLVRYAVRLVHSIDVAEDLVQEAFLTIWRERTSWKAVGTPQAFVYRVVRDRALQERRRDEMRARKAPEIARRQSLVATPLEVTAAEELHRALQEALMCLPERRREAFVLCRYHRLTLGEVAAITGISTKTVANHVSLAVADLRRALRPFLT